MRIAIIGGGVCGLVIAWRLSQRASNTRITILEKDKIGQAASWAAAGMLAAVVEAEAGEQSLLALGRQAQAAWPAFARGLESATGHAIDYQECGTLLVAHDADGMGWLQQRESFLAQQGYALQRLDRAALRAAEPYLASRVQNGLLSIYDHQVDNRKLVQALQQACLQAGVEIIENTAVDEIMLQDDRATAVRVNDQRYEADHIVLCAGAWSGMIKGIESISPPVYPLKGQMLAVQMNPAAPLLRHVVWTPDLYLVPRANGRLLIGATVEDQGFDLSVTAGGLRHLLEKAWWVLPGIEELPVIETWAGLRPSSPDDAPILGPSALPGLSYATGHHRNGILLAPVTGDLMAEYILSGDVPAPMRPFLASRFQQNA